MLAHAEEVVVDIAAFDQVELVHAAAVHSDMRIGPHVTEIATHSVRRVPQLNTLTGRNYPARCAISTRKGTEVIVERPILFEDVNDMLNLRPERLHLAR